MLVLNWDTGTIRHAVPLGAHVLSLGGAKPALDAMEGLAFVPTAVTSQQPGIPGQLGPSFKGYVEVVSLRRGRIVHTFPSGRRLAMLAVDSHRGRLIMAVGGVRALKQAGNIIVIDISRLREIKVLPLTAGARVDAVATDDSTGRSIVAWQDTDSRNVAIGPGHVVVLDTASGRVARATAVAPEPIRIAICKLCERAYVLSDTGRITTINTASGRIVRIVTLVGNSGDIAIDEKRERVFALLYGTSLGGGLIASLDALSGAILRVIPITDVPQNVTASNIVVDFRFHHVFVEAEALDRSKQPTGGGRILMLDAVSGSLLRTVDVGNDPNGLAVDEGTARVFVATVGPVDPSRGNNPTGTGKVYVLDARTASTRHVVCVGVEPKSVTVAGQVHRAFVLNEGGTVTIRIGGPIWRSQPPWLRPCRHSTPSNGRIECSVAGSISVLDAKVTV